MPRPNAREHGMKSSEFHRDRRHLLFALAAGGATVAAGGASLLVANTLGLSRYHDAVRSIWRHSDRTDLSRPNVQRELVRYGTLAANSHNTQPWRFQLTGKSIVVLPDIGRRCPAVDPDDHHLYASLRCAVENMVHAAKAFAVRAAPAYDSALGGIDVALESGPRERTDLFEAIPHRQSTRTNYDGRPAPADHLRLLEAAGTAMV